MAAQRGEPFGLGAVTPFEDPDHRRLEVVVPNPARHTPEVFKGQHVALQECFLRLGGERDVKRFARVRESHHEHPALHDQPSDRGVELAEVDLSLRARQMGLRDRHLPGLQPELHPATGDMTRHRHLRARGLVLGDEALPDAAGGVALLARRVLIGEEPGIDHWRPFVDRWAGPRRVLLPRRWDRVGECLAHRPTVHLVSFGELADRRLVEPPVLPDVLEQFHA